MATGKTDIKGWIKEEFAPLAKQHKFKIGTFFGTGTFAIYRNDDHGYQCIWFDIDSWSVGYGVIVRINAVEELLFEYSQLPVFRTGDTLCIPNKIGKFEYSPFTTKEELMAYLAPLKEQFAEVVAQLEFYTNPQHVLDLWLSLKTQEERSAYFFGSYKYCKMIVVAHLCCAEEYSDIAKNALEIYRGYIAEGKDWHEELSVCEKIIAHYEQ